MLPGDYWSTCRSTANGWAVRRFAFVAQPDSDIALPCIDRALIERIGLDFEKLSPAARSELRKAQSAGCVDLSAMIADAAVAFDMSQLRLDISVPQVAMLHKPRGYVSPELWDRGVPSATAGLQPECLSLRDVVCGHDHRSSRPVGGNQFRQLAPAPAILRRGHVRASPPLSRISPPTSLTTFLRSAAT